MPSSYLQLTQFLTRSANACEPVKQVLESAVDENQGLLRVVRVNIDINEDAVDEANVLALPAVHFWLSGQHLGALVGKSALGRLGDFINSSIYWHYLEYDPVSQPIR